jgi:hypothetical protein
MAAAETPRATPILAPRTSKPILEATAKPTSAIASQRSVLFIVDRNCLGPIRARTQPLRNLHELTLDLQAVDGALERAIALPSTEFLWSRAPPQVKREPRPPGMGASFRGSNRDAWSEFPRAGCDPWQMLGPTRDNRVKDGGTARLFFPEKIPD